MENHLTRVRVRYADVDAMGVAYNSVYLVWFEVGRTEWLRERGVPYREVEARGISLPVTEASIRFRSGARYDQEIEIDTWIDEVLSRRVVFQYRITCSGKQIADGRTVHVPVEIESGRSIRVPAWLTQIISEPEQRTD